MWPSRFSQEDSAFLLVTRMNMSETIIYIVSLNATRLAWDATQVTARDY